MFFLMSSDLIGNPFFYITVMPKKENEKTKIISLAPSTVKYLEGAYVFKRKLFHEDMSI